MKNLIVLQKIHLFITYILYKLNVMSFTITLFRLTDGGATMKPVAVEAIKRVKAIFILLVVL